VRSESPGGASNAVPSAARECRKRAAPAAEERAGASGSSGLIARFANETSNLAAGRGQPVATPGPARPAHRIQSVWVRLVTTRQKLDCLPLNAHPLTKRWRRPAATIKGTRRNKNDPQRAVDFTLLRR
jgi:hypothetical protein